MCLASMRLESTQTDSLNLPQLWSSYPAPGFKATKLAEILCCAIDGRRREEYHLERAGKRANNVINGLLPARGGNRDSVFPLSCEWVVVRRNRPSGQTKNSVPSSLPSSSTDRTIVSVRLIQTVFLNKLILMRAREWMSGWVDIPVYVKQQQKQQKRERYKSVKNKECFFFRLFIGKRSLSVDSTSIV